MRPVSLLLALGTLMAAGSTPAATITWGPATDDTLNAASNAFVELDIKTNGTFVAAVCNGNAGTLNGVTFTGWDSYNTDGTYLITYGASPITLQWAGNRGSAGWGSPSSGYGVFGYSNGPAANLLLTGGGEGLSPGTITLSSLVAGNSYQLQIWAPTWNQTLGTSVDGVSLRIGQPPATLSQYVVGTFTADNTNQTISWSGVAPSAISLRFMMAPPAGLTAIRGAAIGSVLLNWTGVPQATAYNVKRSTTTGAGYMTIGTASGTSYTDLTAQILTNYYYVVSSTNSAGESGNSVEVSITLPAPGTVIMIF